MLQIHTEPIYKRIGQDYVQIVRKNAPKVDNFVPNVSQTITDNGAGKFSNLRKKAEQLAKELNITYEKALQVLQQRGEHLIDILAWVLYNKLFFV